MGDSAKTRQTRNRLIRVGYAAITAIFASAFWSSFGNIVTQLLQNNAFIAGVMAGGGLGLVTGSVVGSLTLDYIETRKYERRQMFSEEEIASIKRRRRKKRFERLTEAIPYLIISGGMVYVFANIGLYVSRTIVSRFDPVTPGIFWTVIILLTVIGMWYTGER